MSSVKRRKYANELRYNRVSTNNTVSNEPNLPPTLRNEQTASLLDTAVHKEHTDFQNINNDFILTEDSRGSDDIEYSTSEESNFSIDAFTDEQTYGNVTHDDNSDYESYSFFNDLHYDSNEKIYADSEYCIDEFVSEFLILKLKGNISDLCANQLLKMFKKYMKQPNLVPSNIIACRKHLHKSVPLYAKTLALTKREKISNDEELLEYPFLQLVKLNVIHNYKHYARFITGDNELTLDLLLHSDGAQICVSDKNELWPLTASIVQLEDRMRFSFHNLIPISMSVSNKKPSFKELCRQVKNFDTKKFVVINMKKTINDKIENKMIKLRVKFQGLTGDIPAIRSLMNLTFHTSNYSCTGCYVYGTKQFDLSERSKRLCYLYEENTAIRSQELYEEDLDYLRSNPLLKSHYGVVGESFLGKNILITQLITDYMHTSLMGPISQDFMLLIDGFDYNNRGNVEHASGFSDINKQYYERSISRCKYTLEMKRKLRSLNDVTNYKSSEWKLVCLYSIPIMILPCCNDDKRQLSHLLLLLCCLISSLLTENLSADNLDSIDKSFKLWFNERSKHLGSIALSLKSHLHLHYKNLYEKFGP